MTTSDNELFLTQMEGVKPLNQNQVNVRQKSAKSGLSQFRQRQSQNHIVHLEQALKINCDVEFVDPYDLLSYKKSGVQQGVFKNLRLAKYDLEASFDLQGKTLQEAKALLIKFITDCTKRNIRVLLIKHGLGLEGLPQAKLKSHINQWLPLFDNVLAFHSAKQQHGSYSACYVLLSKNEQAKIANKEVHSKK